MAVAQLKFGNTIHSLKKRVGFLTGRQFLKHKLAVVGMVIVFIFVFLAIFANVLAPYDPYKQNLAPSYSNPSSEHLLGTDELGRDVFSRLLYAARISLFVTDIVQLCGRNNGVIVGAVSGYFGKWVDALIQRVVEFLLTLPTLPLLLFFSAMLRGMTIPDCRMNGRRRSSFPLY